ncbi:DUF4240 domain-containing protein [Streptomyces mirabilis]
MNADSFWEFIEGCREQAHGRGERLAWLRGALSQRPLTEIVQFQVCVMLSGRLVVLPTS